MRAGVGLAVLLAIAGLDCRAEDQSQWGLSVLGAGAFASRDLGLVNAEVKWNPRGNVALTAAPTWIFAEGAGTETQFRLGGTVSVALGPIRFDERNLLVWSDRDRFRYRNRLRMTYPVQVAGRPLRLQVYDEVFYRTGPDGWFRNVLAGGLGLDVSSRLSLDAYGLFLDDDHRASWTMALVTLSLRIR